MPLDESYVGRTWPAETYAVGREKVREFATVVGATDAIHHDPEAARAAGYPDVVAPVTFGVVFTWQATRKVVADPGLGLDFARVVHREQGIESHRPVHAGDEVTTVVSISEVRELAGNDVVTFRTDVTDADGEPVLVTTSTLVGRAEPS